MTKDWLDFTNKYSNKCCTCRKTIEIGSKILWNKQTKKIRHKNCSAPARSAGSGSSAARLPLDRTKNILSKEDKLELINRYNKQESIPRLLEEYKITLDFLYGLIDGSDLLVYIYPYLKQEAPF